MDITVRLESMKIAGVKNVEYGELEFEEFSDILKGNFDKFKSVLGIYGQNGSGKTTAIESAKIMKQVLSGGKLPDDIGFFIGKDEQGAKIECTFFVKISKNSYLVTYSFIIRKIRQQESSVYDIVYEKMTYKEFHYSKNKWNSMKTLFEIEGNEIVLKKFLNRFSRETYIGLKVAKEIETGSSFVFNPRNFEHIVRELKNDEDVLVQFLHTLNEYAKTGIIIIENDLIGSINLNTYMPVNVYLPEQNSLKMGEIAINLTKMNELPEQIFSVLKKVIAQIDVVLNAIVPTLNIATANEQKKLMQDGSYGYSFEIVSIRDEKTIPLKYESEGIKRIISVTSSLIAMYNNPSICLMIDEFDSGIFEYLLGELIEIIYESAKGQFLFTSHNLRILEKIPYKSIVLTSVNPSNRYIRFTGVKPNNNIRDFYYTGIILGGQNESLYNETKNYKIKKAFRNAGKMYE